MNWNTQPIGYRQTQAVANNQLAAAQRSSAGKSSAGRGLGRGAGQRSLDAYRQDMGRAQGFADAGDTRMQDSYANFGQSMQARYGRLGDSLSYDTIAEQMRQSLADARFNNFTTAWGALAGLLR